MIPGWGRSPGVRNGNPLQYSYQENPMERAWRATVHGVTETEQERRPALILFLETGALFWRTITGSCRLNYFLSINTEETPVSLAATNQNLSYSFQQQGVYQLFMSFFICSCPSPVRPLPENSCLPACGILTSWVKPGLWICTSVPCGKNWEPTATSLKLSEM